MYDSPWKEAIEAYFPAFLAFFFPEAYEGIDWTEAHRFLDKELQRLDPKSELGARTVDKLVEVRRRDGEPALILVHVVSLAVLADERPAWRPSGFGYAIWGCRMQLDFPAVKLLDYEGDDLEAVRNPFAVLVQAHLKAQATRRDPTKRLRWKLALVKGFYEQGRSRDEIVGLFRFIDWLMALPEGLDQHFKRELSDFEEDKKMPYVTSIERIGIKKGLREGRLQMARQSVLEALEVRFGAVPEATKTAIHQIAELDHVRELHKNAIQAESLEAFESGL